MYSPVKQKRCILLIKNALIEDLKRTFIGSHESLLAILSDFEFVVIITEV